MRFISSITYLTAFYKTDAMSQPTFDDRAVASRVDTPFKLGAYVALLLGAFAFYGLTAARTIQWMDYGQFVVRALEGEVFNEYGLALIHPLYLWASQFAIATLPLSPAHAVALVSAFFGAVTVANVFGCVRSISRNPAAGLVAALGLAVANTFWRMSTMPECYTVTTALLSAELWLLALYLRDACQGRARASLLIAALFFNGLGLANHNLALLTVPVLGVVLIRAAMRKECLPRQVAMACLGWLIGASPYLALIAIEMFQSGDPAGAIHSALFGKQYADNVLNVEPSFQNLAINLAFTVLSFFNLTLPLAVIGAWRAMRSRSGRALFFTWGASLAIHLLFVLRYDVVDQHTFLLPSYTVMVLFAGIGFASLASRWPAARSRYLFVGSLLAVLAAPGVYGVAASVARSQDVLGGFTRNKPYRDDYRYLFVPWGVGETSAEQMADHAVTLAGDDGLIILVDSMARFAVYYALYESGRDEVDVLRVSDNRKVDWPAYTGRPIVFVPASEGDEPSDAPAGMTWVKDDPLFVLRPAALDTQGGVP